MSDIEHELENNMMKANKYKSKIEENTTQQLFDVATKKVILQIVEDFADISVAISDKNPTFVKSQYGDNSLLFYIGDMSYVLRRNGDVFLEDNEISQEIRMTQVIKMCLPGESNLNFTDSMYTQVIIMNVFLGYFYSTQLQDKLALTPFNNLNPFTKAIVKLTTSSIKHRESRVK